MYILLLGSANNQPTTSRTFETIPHGKAIDKTPQPAPYSDYSKISSISDLDSLALVEPVNPESKCENDELCGSKLPVSERRHRNKMTKKLHSTSATESSTFVPFEFESTTVQLPSNHADKELGNHNLRRHSHEEYDIDCESTEIDSVDSVVQPTTSTTIRDVTDKTDPPLESNPTPTSTVQTPTIGESLRRMSESEEMSTECDTEDDQTITTAPEDHMSTDVNESADVTAVSNTESMRRMSESEEIQTDCEYDVDTARIDRPASLTKTMPTATSIYSTPSEDAIATSPATPGVETTPKLKTSTMNELSRRMSESDVDCKQIEEVDEMTPIIDSMRRMADSHESSADCDSHEDTIDLTTVAPFLSDSMRRMSHSDTQTTELNIEDHTEPTTTIAFEDPTEYVTECDTEMPPLDDAQRATKTKENKDNSLLCCPDSVCLLLYPHISSCDAIRFANVVRKIAELRDMFYLYKTQVLITKLVGDSDYINKRIDYEQILIHLWEDESFISQIDITNTCTNGSHAKNAKQIISSIYCFLNYTGNLLNETFLDMILEIVKRIETDFPHHKAVKYPKLRRTIFQSIPIVSNESDVVNLLSDYMQNNRNYEKERIFLLQLLLDIQERFEADMEHYFIANRLDDGIPASTTDSIKSLHENGLGIKMHRTTS